MKILLLALAAFAGPAAIVHAEKQAAGSDKWTRLADCRLVASSADDGDSFYVRQGGKTFLFRLYTVDAPETSMTYADRVAAQAAHFGITQKQAVEAGHMAAKFTSRLLVAPFTVETCWQDATGNSPLTRYYAVVTAGGRDLADDRRATQGLSIAIKRAISKSS